MQGDGTKPLVLPRRRTRMFSVLVGTATAMVCLGAGFAIFGLQLPNASTPQAQASPTASLAGGQTASGKQAAPRLRNVVSKQANEWGVRTCLGQIVTVSDFLTANRAYTALSQKGPANPDAQAFTAAIAAQGPEGMDSVSTFVAAPTEDHCTAAYQTMAAFATDCETARKEHFPSFGVRIDLGDRVGAYGNGKDSYVFLLPVADAGCAALKTQTLYRTE